MKPLKNIFLTSMLILFSCFSYTQEPATITLVTSKNIQNASELVVDLDGEIITNTWKKDAVVRIEIEIRSQDISREVVKYLVSKDRFCIKTLYLDEGTVLIFMPNLKLPVYINGIKLSEEISFQLFVPKEINVKIRSRNELYAYKAVQDTLVKPVKILDPLPLIPANEIQKRPDSSIIMFKDLKKGDQADFLSPTLFWETKPKINAKAKKKQ